MKKILSLTIIAIIALIGLSVSVNAAEVSDEATIKAALTRTDATITLTKDITLTTPLEVEREVTIDLNGYSITPAANFNSENNSAYDYVIGVRRQGDLTIKDSASNGKVSNDGMKLVVVKMTVKGENDATYAAKFTLQSGMLEDTYASTGFATISGNGTRHNTVITINGGTVKSSSGHAIYHPQDGKVTINGGKIEGITGIEMRSGNLQVNDGTIIGTGVPSSSEANGSGATTIGAGVAIAQHSTEKNLSVVIDGGNIEGYSAVYESNPNDATEFVSIEINGGEFKATNGGTEAVYSENKTGFITGGTFSVDISEYLSEGAIIAYDGSGNCIVIVPVDLDTPTNLKWDGTKATWDAVSNADEYVVILTNGEWNTNPIFTEDTSVDFSKYLIDENGKYVFIVQAYGNWEPYYPSDYATSEAYVFPVEEDKNEEKPSTGEVQEEQEPEEEKDITPTTGSVDVVLFASAIVAVISLAGIVMVKKYTK